MVEAGQEARSSSAGSHRFSFSFLAVRGPRPVCCACKAGWCRAAFVIWISPSCGAETICARHRLHSVLNRLAFYPALMLSSPCSATGTAPGAAPRGSRAAVAREGRRYMQICPLPPVTIQRFTCQPTALCIPYIPLCGPFPSLRSCLASCACCIPLEAASEGSHSPCPFFPCSFTPVPSSTSNPSALRVCSAFNLLPAAPGHAVPVLHSAVH